MTTFNFYYPIQIRYGDLDPQWHVNNAHTVILIEQARTSYLVQVGLWNGKDFNQLGLIVADIHVSYKAPITMLQQVRIGVRVARIGTKSLVMEYALEDISTQQILATGESIMVAFDYPTNQSIPVPADWREKIQAFEGIE